MMALSQDQFILAVKRLQDGDDAAMCELIEHYGAAMQRIAKSLIGRALQAQLDAVDLVQAMQITLWVGLRLGRFKVPTPRSLMALAKVLLRRQVARYWRTAKLEMNATLEGHLAETLVDQDLFAAKHANGHQSEDLDDLVAHFLNRLDPIDQQLMKLRIQGYRTAEAAACLQLDAGYLRVRLGRLRKKFTDFSQELARR